MSLNNRTAGVVDVILSNHARGYRNALMVGAFLMPIAPVPARNIRLIKFGKESFRLLNTRRAPGAGTKRVQYGYASDPIALYQDALEALVPFEHQEEAGRVPGIDLAAGAINMTLDVTELNQEVETANLARNPANYGANNKMALAGADKWSDPDSDPSGDVDEAKEQIRRRIGRYPNKFNLGPVVFNALKNHPKILEKFKYTSSDSITVAMLASYFGVDEVKVGQAVYLPETAGDDEDAIDVWGNDAILAFSPTAETGNFQVPSYGYQYQLTGYPQVEQPYSDRNHKSWIYPTTSERRPYLTGADAGFLFQGAA